MHIDDQFTYHSLIQLNFIASITYQNPNGKAVGLIIRQQIGHRGFVQSQRYVYMHVFIYAWMCVVYIGTSIFEIMQMLTNHPQKRTDKNPKAKLYLLISLLRSSDANKRSNNKMQVWYMIKAIILYPFTLYDIYEYTCNINYFSG